MLKRHGYPVSGEHPYMYRQNESPRGLRRHPDVEIEHAARLRLDQYPPNLGLPIARDDTGTFTQPHWLPCEFIWRGDA